MTVVAIVQARMTSTRLPGKVLADLDGRPMLASVAARIAAARLVDEVRVACTELAADDPIAGYCALAGIPVFRGSETDVLGRYLAAAEAAGADVVIRLTADCPLLDPAVIDDVVSRLVPGIDYAANVLERSYPRGLDVEAFTIDALRRMNRLGTSAAAREHVTIPARLELPEAFSRVSVRSPTDDSDLRWTVDTGDDLHYLRRLYWAHDLSHRFVPYRDLVRWCRANPEWLRTDDARHTWDPSRAGSIPALEEAP